MALQFKVPSMVCEGCADTVKKAIATLDPQAKVTVDLASKGVVAETQVAMSEIQTAIAEQGHTVE
ncbi:MAG: heavy-metal-associated domain-containing protein [Spirulinaceae cyanobacterium RM2_2_10]|nr:heavy-metal-associated domain-containing protein [Spirulinaceae cyanobacterium SM2_1_0]NJO19737.1 heavy-metal-associated domain-containing protein [Spirulinaceae cyanobacterium RM2_2_10]